jgi:hypothetical protein
MIGSYILHCYTHARTRLIRHSPIERTVSPGPGCWLWTAPSGSLMDSGVFTGRSSERGPAPPPAYGTAATYADVSEPQRAHSAEAARLAAPSLRPDWKELEPGRSTRSGLRPRIANVSRDPPSFYAHV